MSTVNLHRDCPPSLLQALASTHPDREVWLQTYYEEKGGIEEMGTFRKITMGEYRAFREKGAPKAIPTMCVLTIKKDEQLMPLQAKSRVVVLGNCEGRNWSKSEHFAPVLLFDSLRFLVSLSAQPRCGLQQGDCKNAFCQGILPPEETTIVQPPFGNPDAGKDEYWLLLKTLYGLCRSPRHWYEKIDAILRSIGLTPSSHDPCLYSGYIHNPKDPSGLPSSKPLLPGLYVDDFIYFLEDPATEALFERLLREQIKVDFMGLFKWFLGIHFSWQITNSAVDVHMSQSGFAANLVEQFCRDEWDPTPDATPYQSGVPIDSIAPSSDVDDSPTQRKHIRVWLAALVGWPAPHIPILLRSTPSFCRTAASQLPVTYMRLLMHSITFTLLMTTELPSHPPSPHPSIHMYTFRTHRTSRLILTLFLHLEQKVHLSLLIVMLIGDLRLAPPFMTGLSFLSSNSGV